MAQKPKRRPNPAHAAGPDTSLTDESRAFIVTQFAMYLTAQQVADLVNAEFGLRINRQNANRYNPESMAGRKMAPKWKKLHAEVRERFHESHTAIPMANRNARLRQLQAHYEEALSQKNRTQCLSILEQIAKEVGNVHSDTRKVHHSGTIESEPPMSIEEKRNYVLDRVLEAMEQAAGAKVNAPGTGTTQ